MIYQKLDVDNLESIQRQIIERIPKDFFQKTKASYVGSQQESIDRFLDIKDLKKIYDRLQVTDYIQSIIINACNRKDNLINEIHSDYGDFIYSINIPIVNTKNTFIHFYDVEGPGVYMPNGDTWYPTTKWSKCTCTHIESVEMTQPILVNVSVPHSYTNHNDSQRIVLLTRLGKSFTPACQI